jgi:hypothetical protein
VTDKFILVLQNSMHLEKCVQAPCSETYSTSSRDANLDMNIKVEAVSDIEVEEEHPLTMSFIGIKAEHEVSCVSVCSLPYFTCNRNCLLSHIFVCLSVHTNRSAVVNGF